MADATEPFWTFYDNFAAFPHASMGGDDKVFAEVIVSLDDPDGGTHGEFKVRWYEFSHGDFSPRIEAFADAWKVLGLAQPRWADLLRRQPSLVASTPLRNRQFGRNGR